MKTINSLLKSLDPDSFKNESTNDLISWIDDQNQAVKISLNLKNLSELDLWDFNYNKITHKTGKFFSVEGLSIKGKFGNKQISWDQPIINQPEYGYLGIICKEINGVLHFLLQAKIEPGNINKVQLSPTIQATRSNFTKVHLGKTPHYLEYFTNPKPENILIDQLQTEQGSRFFKKRNRNIIIYNQNVEAIDDRFRWFTLSQINRLMSIDNMVNMDTRTVISCLPIFYSLNHLNFLDYKHTSKSENMNALFKFYSINSDEYINNWLTFKKLKCDILVNKIPLKNLKNWNISKNKISHEDDLFFDVIGVDVSIENREVVNWNQPMIKPKKKGLIALAFCKINDTPHFLVKTKFEIGSFDKIEFAPSIQTSNSIISNQDKKILELFKRGKRIFSTLQSEEGGRFFNEENLNEIYEIDYYEIKSYDSDFQWLNFNQIQRLIRYSGLVNIQLRTLISIVKFNI